MRGPWFIALILAAAFQIVSPLEGVEAPVTTRFTGLFTVSASFDPAFARLSRRAEFQERVVGTVQAALAGVPHLNFVPLDPEQAEKTGTATRVDPNTLFIRGLVSRADVRKVTHFSTDEYVFSTTVALEFFDLVSGEIFYTRTLTGQVFKEVPGGHGLSTEETGELLGTCLQGTVKELVEKIGEDYQPGVLEGPVVAVLDSATVVLGVGRADGVYQGMTFYLYENPGGPPVGMVKLEAPQERFCRARVVVRQGGPPTRGWTARSFGVNRLVLQKGQSRYMVVRFSPARPEELPPDFRVGTPELGQWLHDGLSAHTDLFMLAPVLAELDSSGAVRVDGAVWQAQVDYAVFANVAQGAIVGRRAFPDVLVRGIVTYADVQRFVTPGAENQILTVGISVEFYDRKTRDFLYAHQHSGRKAEKIVKADGKVYRDVNLETSFRDLCKEVIREAAAHIGRAYRPLPFQGEVAALRPDGTFLAALPDGDVGVGDLFNLVREGRRITGLSGEDLGALWQTYGIAKVMNPAGEDRFVASLLVSDGSASVQPGDLLRADGKQPSSGSGRLCRVVAFPVEEGLAEEYTPASGLLIEWLHEALLSTGKLRLLPPDFRAAEMSVSEAALTLGQFEARDQREVIYQGVRTPEVLIRGRVGLADVTVKPGEFKDELKLRTGVEVSFLDAAGDTLYSRKLAGSRSLEQVKAKGRVMIGPGDLAPEFNGLTQNTIRTLVDRIVQVYVP